MNIYEELKLLEEEVQKASSREALDLSFKKWREENLLPLREKIKKLGLKFQEMNDQAQEIYQKRKDKLSTWKNIFGGPREPFPFPHKKVNFQSTNYLSKVISSIGGFLESNGFEYYEESEIVNVKENFDDLLMPEGHPARANSDSYYLKNLDENDLEKKMLRTHNTTSTLKLLEKFKGKPFKGASLGTVYRNEADDTTHLSQFTQLDLVWVDKELNIDHLKELIESLLNRLLLEKREKIPYALLQPNRLYIKKELSLYRLRNSYFPFTSPSFEVDLKCPCNLSKDCRLCKGTGWIEILGCGFLKNEIIKKTHPNHWALALGLGVERICMIKNSISDIRSLYKNNFSEMVKSKQES